MTRVRDWNYSYFPKARKAWKKKNKESLACVFKYKEIISSLNILIFSLYYMRYLRTFI